MPSTRPSRSPRSALWSVLFAICAVALFLVIAGVLGFGDIAATPFGLVLAVLLAYGGARFGRRIGQPDT